MWKHIKWLNEPPVNISNSESQNIPYNKQTNKKKVFILVNVSPAQYTYQN